MKTKARSLTGWILLLACTPCIAGPTPPAQPQVAVCAEPSSLRGAWEKREGGGQLLIDADRIVIRSGDSLRVATILSHEPCKLVVRDHGLKSSWEVTLEAGELQIRGNETWPLRPLATIPPDLALPEISLPPPPLLERAALTKLQEELLHRARKDQAALTNPALKATRSEVLADNVRFLRSLVNKAGWIDIPRFGKDAAAAAILIAKHGSDLPLMKAALPVVETDVKQHGGSGEMFSVLYDELQITLGHRQRFGTQVAEDAAGKPFVLPVEEPSLVDVFRKSIGILPWKEYLQMVSETLYDGNPIRIAGTDE